MKHFTLLLIFATMLSMIGCSAYTTPLQQQTTDYVLNEEIIPADAEKLATLSSQKIDENTIVSKLILFENESDVYALCLDNVSENFIRATVYTNVIYSSKKDKDDKQPTYTVNLKHAVSIWDKKISYGDIVIEDWEDLVYE